jgi:benzoate/toluate 1,2-dioxygenase subunit alpha
MTVTVASSDDRAEVQGMVEPGRVRRDIYLDEKLFDLEMERIFLHTWVYVGHESEIALPGDYKTTTIGAEPVILSRSRQGEIRVLVNRCRHKGASVCQRASGNASSFRCHYHGWTYDASGKLVGVSFPDGYENLDKEALSLASAPKVESYRGLIFASFDEDVPALVDWLAGARKYIDMFVDHVPGHELEVTRSAHRLTYRGNWKLQMENGLDGYHANFTHESFFSLMQRRTAQASRYISPAHTSDSVALGNGHSLLDQRAAATGALTRRLATLPGAPAEDNTDYDAFFGTPNAEALYKATPGPVFNLGVFPNLQLIGIQIREIRPVSVSETEVILRPTLGVGLPAQFNRLRLRYHELFYGPAGFGQPDDIEMFERVSVGIASHQDDWLNMDRGMGRRRVDDQGNERADITDETPQRSQYAQWLKMMGLGR